MYPFPLSSPHDLFSEFDRLQREMQRAFGAFGFPSSIRAMARGSFPAINIGSTPQSVEVYAFAPGVDPAKFEVNIDRGLLTIAGERPDQLPEESEKTSIYTRERHTGPFKRVVSLPDDADPSRVQATYRDGVLHISVQRKESARAQRIEVK